MKLIFDPNSFKNPIFLFTIFITMQCFAQNNIVNKALVKAAYDAQTATVKALIGAGADVNAIAEIDIPWGYGKRTLKETPLSAAIKRSDIETISFLLDSGANVNFNQKGNFRPLLIAASLLRADVVKLLLSSGAKDFDGTIAATVGGFGFNEFIDKYPGAYTNNKIKYSIEIIQLLMEQGVSIDDVDKSNNPAILIATENYTMRLLDDNKEYKYYKPISLLEFFIENGANVNSKGFFGVTPLISAAKENNAEALAALLETDIDVNMQTDRGKTALMLAIDIELDPNNWIVEKEEDKDHVNRYYELQERSYNTKQKILKSLIDDSRIDINIQDNEGSTVLIHIIKSYTNWGHCWLKQSNILEYIQMLLDKGADINLQDKSGKSPLIYAVENGYYDIQNLLVSSANK